MKSCGMVGHNPGTNRLDFERSRLLTCVFLRHCCVLETARATVLGVRYAAISQILQTSREDFFSVFSCISAKKIIAHAKKRCFLLLRGSVLTRSWCSAKHFGTARCNSFLINSVKKNYREIGQRLQKLLQNVYCHVFVDRRRGGQWRCLAPSQDNDRSEGSARIRLCPLYALRAADSLAGVGWPNAAGCSGPISRPFYLHDFRFAAESHANQ